VGEQGGIIKVPETTGVVHHGVKFAGNEVVAGEKTMGPLEEGVKSQKVRAGGGGSSGALSGPSNSGAIVSVEPQGAFVDVALGRQERLMGDGGCKFQVGDGQGPRAARGGDKGGADGVRKGQAPEERGGRRAVGIEPHAAHAPATGVAGANIGGR
jgi:hypothetical protein